MNYIVRDDIIIFNFKSNKKLNLNLLSYYKKVIFSDYELNECLFDEYESKNFKKLHLQPTT